MPILPHDIDDLALAPVVLAVDARLDELGQLDVDHLNQRVILETNHSAGPRDAREADLLRTIGRFIELHGWELSWDPRGLRVNHSHHSVVLGVPNPLLRYLEGGVT